MAKKRDDKLFVISGILCILIIVMLVVLFMIPEKTPEKEQQKTLQNQEPVKAFENQQINIKNLPAYKKYKFMYTYYFTVNGNVSDFEFTLPIPHNENYRQRITDFTITPTPASIEKENCNLVAKYKIPSLKSGKFKIVLEGNAAVFTYNINTAKKINYNVSSKDKLLHYLEPKKYIESADPYIITVANSITGSSREEIVENTYKYIQDRMIYKVVEENMGAKQALQEGYGKCSEYAEIMTAILRAKKIPARIAAGNIARESDTEHNWVEVYYDEYGWVTYDPTITPREERVYSADGKLKRIEKHYDTSLDNVYYIQSSINVFSPYILKYSTDEKNGGSVQVQSNITIRKIY